MFCIISPNFQILCRLVILLQSYHNFSHFLVKCKNILEFTRLLTSCVDCRKKIEEIGEKTCPTMTQEEIISSTKTVVQGLETLRVEHHHVLNGLQTNSETANNACDTSTADLIEEKISLLKKSIETIELAMGEAQVIIA